MQSARIEPDKAAQLRSKVHNKLAWVLRLSAVFVALGLIFAIASLPIFFWPEITEVCVNM